MAQWEFIDNRTAKCSSCVASFSTGGEDKTKKCLIHYAVYQFCPHCGELMSRCNEDLSMPQHPRKSVQLHVESIRKHQSDFSDLDKKDMKHFMFAPTGVCSVMIEFDLDEECRIHSLQFAGGCNGNLKSISKLLENQPAQQVIEMFNGNTCGAKKTSCTDQLSIALKQALNGDLLCTTI